MSKPVKNLIVDSYKKRFEGLTGGVLIDVRGIKSNETNELRAGLAKKQIKVTIVKNSLAKKAFEGGELPPHVEEERRQRLRPGRALVYVYIYI